MHKSFRWLCHVFVLQNALGRLKFSLELMLCQRSRQLKINLVLSCQHLLKGKLRYWVVSET